MLQMSSNMPIKSLIWGPSCHIQPTLSGFRNYDPTRLVHGYKRRYSTASCSFLQLGQIILSILLLARGIALWQTFHKKCLIFSSTLALQRRSKQSLGIPEEVEAWVKGGEVELLKPSIPRFDSVASIFSERPEKAVLRFRPGDRSLQDTDGKGRSKILP